MPAPTAVQRVLGTLCYVGPLVLIPAFQGGKSGFLRFHVRQGLYLFVLFVVVFVATLGLLMVFRPGGPLAADFPFLVLSVLMLVELIAYAVASLAMAFQTAVGRMALLPVLGDLSSED